MEVKYLKIGEQDFPVHYGLSTMADFFHEVGIEAFADVSRVMGPREFLYIVYHGIKGGLRKEGKPCRLTYYKIADMLEDNYEDITPFITLFNSEMPKLLEKMGVSEESLEKAKS